MNSELFKGIPRKKLIQLIEMYAGSAMTIDGLWFTILEDKIGMDQTVDIDVEVWRRYAAKEVSRVKRIMGIKAGGLDGLAQALRYQVWCIAPGFTCDIQSENEDTLVFTAAGCRVQEARLKNNRGEFPCRPVNQAVFEEYARAFDPRIRLHCRFCPPGRHPDDVWCSWEFRLE